MNLKEKLQNSICIKIGKDLNGILTDEEYKEEQVAMFGGEYFGFIIMSDNNGMQRECFYPAHCKIEEVRKIC